MEREPGMRPRPLAPHEVVEAKKELIPDVVIETFNTLLAERGMDGHVTIYQDEVVAQLEALGLQRREIYDRHWLDVEPLYREAGWTVEYDKPSYGDNDFRAYFQFSIPG